MAKKKRDKEVDEEKEEVVEEEVTEEETAEDPDAEELEEITEEDAEIAPEDLDLEEEDDEWDEDYWEDDDDDWDDEDWERQKMIGWKGRPSGKAMTIGNNPFDAGRDGAGIPGGPASARASRFPAAGVGVLIFNKSDVY